MRNLLTLNLKTLESDIKSALKAAAKEVADNMEEPTKTWAADHKPKFGVVGPNPDGMGNLTAFGGVLPGQGEQAQVYLWVTRGTEAHNIYPKPENEMQLLVFYSPYHPSTTYRSFSSVKASTGDTKNRRPSVRHPGAKAREFEEAAAEIAQKSLVENVRNAVAGMFSGGQRWVSW